MNRIKQLAKDFAIATLVVVGAYGIVFIAIWAGM